MKKGSHHKPEAIVKMSNAKKGKIRLESSKQKQSKTMKDKFRLDPIFRQMMKDAHKKMCADPAYRQSVSRALKGVDHSDPVYRQKISNTLKGHDMPQEVKDKISKTLKIRWENMNIAEKDQMIRTLREKANIRPNRAEIELNNVLDAILPNEYKYVGDGSFILGGMNPDFMNINGQKKLIELYGDYWHKDDDPQERIDYFKQFGFQTLVVWEHKLKDVRVLKETLLEFNNKKR
jgi:hypothetical protein